MRLRHCLLGLIALIAIFGSVATAGAAQSTRWIGPVPPNVSASDPAVPEGQVRKYDIDPVDGTIRFDGLAPQPQVDIQPGGPQPLISGPYNPPTSNNNFILQPISVPYAALGFAHAGRADGYWANRGGFTTGIWTGRVAYGVAGGPQYTSPTLGPGSYGSFSGVSSVVTIVRIL